MSGDRISDMTTLPSLGASGDVVPVVRGGVNYKFDLAAGLALLPSNAALASDAGATLIGSDDDSSGALWGTVAGFIDYWQSETRLLTSTDQTKVTIQARATQAGLGGVVLMDAPVDFGTSPIDMAGATFLGTSPGSWLNTTIGSHRNQNPRRPEVGHWDNSPLYEFQRYVANGSAVTVVTVGDSMWAGLLGARVRVLFAEVSTVTCLDFSNGGKSAYNFNNDTIGTGKTRADIVAAGGKLYIFGFSLNDPLNGRTRAQAFADYRAMIAYMRAAYPVGMASFLLCTTTPSAATTTYSTGYNQDQVWAAEAGNFIRDVAEEFQCGLFDVSAIYADGSVDRDPDTDGFETMLDADGVHMNQALPIEVTARALLNHALPEGVTFDRFAYRSTVISAASPPSAFDPGGRSFVAATGNGFPFDGVGYLERIPNSTWTIQWLQQISIANPLIMVRAAVDSANFSEWLHVAGYQDFFATAGTGMTMPTGGNVGFGMRARKEGNRVTASGFIDMTVPAMLTAGQVLATFPAGCRPAFEPCWPGYILKVWNGSAVGTDSNWEVLKGRVNADGTIVCGEAGALNASRIYLDADWQLT